MSLSYLWRRDQSKLLSEMIGCGMEAVLVKVASLGLTQEHLGKSLAQMNGHLTNMVQNCIQEKKKD